MLPAGRASLPGGCTPLRLPIALSASEWHDLDGGIWQGICCEDDGVGEEQLGDKYEADLLDRNRADEVAREVDCEGETV